jgi:hypothetical protein
MKRMAIIGVLALVGCSRVGYWPTVASGMDSPQYNADVRDCQTASQDGEDHFAFLTGGALAFNADMALVGQRAESKARIDSCMTGRGYRVLAN